jgi:ABC-type antimicrobial peptide transport system ATPase subunit
LAPLLHIKDLHTEFRTGAGVVRAVDGISYTVEQGETVAISSATPAEGRVDSDAAWASCWASTSGALMQAALMVRCSVEPIAAGTRPSPAPHF